MRTLAMHITTPSLPGRECDFLVLLHQINRARGTRQRVVYKIKASTKLDLTFIPDYPPRTPSNPPCVRSKSTLIFKTRHSAHVASG